MQCFCNVATAPIRKISKSSNTGYYEFRAAESQAGVDAKPTFYTVRLMADKDPCLKLGDFVRVTGKLKVDFYLSRQGEPSGTLLVIAFEATKKTKTPKSEEPAISIALPVQSGPKDQAVHKSQSPEWSD